MSSKQSYVCYDYTTGLVLDYTETADGVWGVACYVDKATGECLTSSTPVIVANDVYHMEFSAREYLVPELDRYMESIGV